MHHHSFQKKKIYYEVLVIMVWYDVKLLLLLESMSRSIVPVPAAAAEVLRRTSKFEVEFPRLSMKDVTEVVGNTHMMNSRQYVARV